MTDKKERLSELLSILAEEASEVIHSCMKIQRFGWEKDHPRNASSFDNTGKLHEELGNVTLAMLLCMEAGLIDWDLVKKLRLEKAEKIKPLLYDQESLDALEKVLTKLRARDGE